VVPVDRSDRMAKAAKNGRATGETDDQASIGRVLCARVRELRRKKGWTLEEMSAACGVSRSMLSEIERQRANPTLAVAYRIAQAFGMSLGELVELPEATRRIDLIRAEDRTYHYRTDRHCRIRTLSPLHLEKSVEYYEVVLQPGGALRSLPHFEGARELLTVQSGRVRVTCADDAEELRTGDSAHYPADVPHAIDNIAESQAVLFLVVTYLRD
jgi:transcriptional regulator with XRE-family HTH domain